MTATGFIGLGAMGAHMVRHMCEAGLDVFVYDQSADAMLAAAGHGAKTCTSVRDVADRAEIVLVCLPTPDVVKAVAVGPDGISGGRVVRIYVDHSTTGPSVAREVGVVLAQSGIEALDGPLAGGVARAKSGTLSVMGAGNRVAFDEVEPVFRTFGAKVEHVGDQVGQGQVLKLVNNMIVGTNLIAASEAMVFGIRSGIPADRILDMLNASTGRSFVTEDLLPRILERRFDFGFRMELMLKDLRLYVQESAASGASSIVNAAASKFYESAVASGLGQGDMIEVVRQMEDAAGVRIARTGEA
ncbi:NAD(P)-dependent oxidoreductase [Sulfitobacter sp. PR48]|uniref:NAD(P)-dependent oxidoreductase n=1 Tax=Sulfitobacter sp. PR48 TaxID=3028383 RepID=UPI00237B0BAD|nr:NAD(P)-dependent oxidoreductase [Sulfitobacter sp. PR48]MDD9723612.1 NAD(P)-dependent oxidoreductase [Sulfitobacter sp. PR48]